jgi:hypothetical protein
MAVISRQCVPNLHWRRRSLNSARIAADPVDSAPVLWLDGTLLKADLPVPLA